MWSKNKTKVSIRTPKHGPSLSSVEPYRDSSLFLVGPEDRSSSSLSVEPLHDSPPSSSLSLEPQHGPSSSSVELLLKMMMDHVLVFEFKV